MALVPISTRNRINPIPISTVAPNHTFDQVEICNNPNCPVCRTQRRHKHHHKRHHHHRRHHHRKHKINFWDGFLPRIESASSSAVTIQSVELDEPRTYKSKVVTERSVVPVNETERQVVKTTATRRVADDDIVEEAWTSNTVGDDEVICCRAYDGCRCPCWCFIVFIILFIILIIILIVLLVTLL